jgi:phosphatidylglycerol---prolipoprotein diacylglyceryl transferase
VIAAAAAGAAIGSRILYWFEDPALTIAHWRDPAYLLGGKTIVGALIGGLLAVEWAKRRIGETHSTGDLFAAPIALGIAIGRIGCFLTGLADHTYGIATSLPWGVDFGDGIRRHPTQLYESIFGLALFCFLLHLLKRPHREGDVFKAFMVAYFGWRLAIDFLKPEVRIGGLSGIQWACVAMFVYYHRDILRWTIGAKAPDTGAEVETLPKVTSGKASAS